MRVKNFNIRRGECCRLVLGRLLNHRYNYEADVPRDINRAVTGRFLPNAYFSRSAGHRQIFLTLNHVVKSASGHLTAAAGRLFGHWSISSGNDQIFGRCPADVPPTIVRTLSGDRWGFCRLPEDDNESCDHRQVTVW